VQERRLWGRGAGVLVVCAGVVLAAPRAHAQAPGNPAAGAEAPKAPAASSVDELLAQAAVRKKSGDEAMEGLRYADALAAYSDAHAVTKDVALLYNMGRALQALNRFPEALDKLTAFEAAASLELKAKVPRLAKLISEIQMRVSTLTIRTNVEGARVLVRDTVVGKTPMVGPVKLVAGPATIEIEAEGYYAGKKSVDLPGGGELTVALDLFSKSTNGILSVTSSAAGSEVLVDSKRIGIAPVELNVTKGTHQVVVRHPDFRLYETSTVVPAGGSRQVSATLQSASVLTRWWFWGAVGAVVAAGVVVSVASTTERPPDSGTIAPGQLGTESMRGNAGLTMGLKGAASAPLSPNPVLVRF
jgi:hypothetical protein